MKSYKSILSIFTAISFIIAISSFTACGNKKKGYSKVKSGSGMGNKKDKNKHVWGK
tara:strand:- start:224 stop:391 length:168 start_codon:yes stop_codon:yes gene_type:complete